MERQELDSPALKSIGYDEKEKIMEVEFIRGGVYHYFDVPKRVYEELMNADSLVRYFLEHIKMKDVEWKRVG